MRSEYLLVETWADIIQAADHCKATGYCSFDFETNGTKVTEGWFTITGIGISHQPGFGYFIPLNHHESVFRHEWLDVLRYIGIELIEHPGIVKIAWNLLFEYRILLRYGYRIYGRMFDAMLAKYILNEERPHGLKDQVDYYLPEFAGYDLEGKPGKKASQEAQRNFWENIPLYELAEYCALDAECTLRLFIHYENKLIQHDLYHLFRNLYMPLIRVIGKCILDGVMVDREYLEWAVNDFELQIASNHEALMNVPVIANFSEFIIDGRVDTYVKSLEHDIDYKDLSSQVIANKEEKISRVLAGDWTTKKESKLFEPMNFASPKQVAELLYSEDGMNLPIKDRTKTGAPSTGEDTLKKLQSLDDTGFIKKLLELRGLEKLYSTYLKSMLYDHIGEDDMVHPSYLPHGTVTGRFSSRNPNFQNIPRSTTAEAIKKMFIAPKDHFFVETDGSQMELRLVAELSRDKAMLQTFAEGKNIHVNTAVLTTKSEYSLINKARKDENHPQHMWAVKEHKKAKVLNFTILYGASKYKVGEFLSDVMGEHVPPEKAQGFIDDWFEAYPGVEKWIKKTRRIAIKQGFVQSPFGRKRRLPIFFDPQNEYTLRGSWNEGLRQACNALIQGMASDVTQWVSIQVYMATLRKELPRYLRLVSTVHDSNENYIHKNDMATVIPKIITIAHELRDMKKYLRYTLKHVDMKFSAEYGINWGVAHEYKEGTDFIEDYAKSWEEYNKSPFPHIDYS